MDNFAELLELLGPYEALLPFALFGVVILMVLLVFLIKRVQKANKAKKVAPYLVFHQMQISPLGRDLYFKIRNIGDTAKVKSVSIHKRADLKINRFYKDYEVERGKVYGIFVEVIGNKRMDTNFEILVTYQDKIGNTYRQAFHVEKAEKEGKVAKLVTYA